VEKVCPENRIFNFLKSVSGQFHEIDDETALALNRTIISSSFLWFSATGTSPKTSVFLRLTTDAAGDFIQTKSFHPSRIAG
jgi:hypothetical protein